MPKQSSEVIAQLVHAVHLQHTAIDALMARLITADPTFRPTQSGVIWDAVKEGHTALKEWIEWTKE